MLLRTQHPRQPSLGSSLVLPGARMKAETSLTGAICSSAWLGHTCHGHRLPSGAGPHPLPSLGVAAPATDFLCCTVRAFSTTASTTGEPPAACLAFCFTSFKPGLAEKQEFHLEKKKKKKTLRFGNQFSSSFRRESEVLMTTSQKGSCWLCSPQLLVAVGHEPCTQSCVSGRCRTWG